MSALYFEEPSADDVRVQWFAIMLGDQILCSAAAAQKFAKKRTPKTGEGATPKSSSVSCLSEIKADPLLEFTLWPDWLNANGKAFMVEIVNYAKKTSPKMEQYMLDAYNTLLQTEDHLYMMAAIFYYVSWMFTYDPQTFTITARNAPPPDSFLRTYLTLDAATTKEVCAACYDFERGRNQMISFPSFVHTLVTNHFKRVR